MPRRERPRKREPTQPKTVSATEILKKIRLEKEAKQKEEEEKAVHATEASSDGVNVRLSDFITNESWKEALKEELEAPYFLKIQQKINEDLSNDKDIYPETELIFNALNLTPLDKVKVVLLGLEPYYDIGLAQGLSYSVPEGVTVPRLVWNLFKELQSDCPWFKIPEHGCLEKWAEEGVLLLNSILTVEAHKSGSHSNYGWQKFTDNIIRLISRKCDSVVFIFLGPLTHDKEALVNLSQHTVIKAPLCGNKKFFGCKCFSAANAALAKAGKTPIEWTL